MFKRAIFPATLILLCLIGFIASFTLAEEYYYLDLPKVAGESPAIFHRISSQACGGQNSFFSCATVAKSRYAALFGVPLAIYGLFFYLAALWMSCAFAFTPERLRKPAAVLLFWVTLLGVAEAIVLLFIAIAAVKAMCPLCLLTYILNLLLFITVVWFLFHARINPLKPFAPVAPQGAPLPQHALAASLLTLVVILGAAAGVAREADAYLKQNKTRFFLAHKEKEIQSAVEAFIRQKPEPIAFTSLPAHGPADAPVTIIEISDFLCPYCAHAADLMDQLAASNPGKINIRFVNLPLDMACNRFMQHAMHRGSCDLAIGAICAAQQDGLEAYQRSAFDLHKNQPGPDDLRAIVISTGLSEEAFFQCLRQPETAGILREQIEQTNQYGINSTPTIFINKKRYQGRLSLEALQKIVDLEIQSAEAKKP